MATAPVLVSLEEYLQTSYKPDVHYVYGELQERSVGKYEHGKMQGWIFQIFNLNEGAWGTDVTVEQRIQVDSSRVRVADVAVMHKSAPREEVITIAPLICVEVLSRDDRLYRAKEVLADYLAMGVRNNWLIDPVRRSAFTFDAQGLHEADPFHLTVPGTPIHLDLSRAFAALD